MAWYDKIREKVRKALRKSHRDAYNDAASLGRSSYEKLAGRDPRVQRWHFEQFISFVMRPSYRRNRLKRIRSAGRSR